MIYIEARVNGRFKKISQWSGAHILMLYVFQKLQFTVRPLRKHGSTEGLHNLLYCDCNASKLILRGAVGCGSNAADKREESITNQTRPNAPGEKRDN